MYQAEAQRYQNMTYRRVGRSGLKLPAISLGLWQNFGAETPLNTQREIITGAFDRGITHFDLANNYGPPAGSAEENFGRIFKQELKSYRDELIISSKAGYYMWEGPYGEWGSKKNLIASCDQSLQRLGMDYVDIFYSHRPDPETPFEETALALDLLVKQGKALYIGISNYSDQQTNEMIKVLKELKTPLLIHQASYNMFNRWIEDGLTDTLKKEQLGAIAYSPLAQGLLTNKYTNGIPQDSRAMSNSPFLSEEDVTSKLVKIQQLALLAQERQQTLAQMALSWILRDEVISSVIIGASRLSQLEENLKALDNLVFSPQELTAIEAVLAK